MTNGSNCSSQHQALSDFRRAVATQGPSPLHTPVHAYNIYLSGKSTLSITPNLQIETEAGDLCFKEPILHLVRGTGLVPGHLIPEPFLCSCKCRGQRLIMHCVVVPNGLLQGQSLTDRAAMVRALGIQAAVPGRQSPPKCTRGTSKGLGFLPPASAIPRNSSNPLLR